MKTSTSGINFIKDREGFSPKAYADGMVNGVQMYSIGYGHQIQPKEAYLKTATISKDKGILLLESDLHNVETVLNASKKPLNQNQYDALASFGYNAGVGSLQKVLFTWNSSGNVIAVQGQMKQYVYTTKEGIKTKLPDLVDRRMSEAAMFGRMVVPSVLPIVGGAALVALYFLFK